MKTVGILTGGGDAPGLNAVIRAIVRRSLPRGYRIVGIRHGWRGILDKDTVALDAGATSGVLHRGGTILGTSRTNPYKTAEDRLRLEANFKALGLDACHGASGLRPVDSWKFCQVTGVGVPCGACIAVPGAPAI